MRLELVYCIAPQERWERTESVYGRTLTIEKPVEYYALVTGDEEEATIREVRRAREMARNMAQAFKPVDALPQGAQRLFTVALDISDVHTANARYGLSRKRERGCPAFVSEDAMAVYAQIKKIFRENLKERRGKMKLRKPDAGIKQPRKARKRRNA